MSPSSKQKNGKPQTVDTVIMSLGNPLRGDDGIGNAVCEILARDTVLPRYVALIDGGIAGLETILLLQGHQRAIIVDAAEMGCLPGEWVRFTREDATLKPADPSLRSTLHSAGLAESLAIGEALGILPDEIIFYGIQPQYIGWQPGLSEPLRAVIPAVCSAILGEIGCSSPYDVSLRGQSNGEYSDR